MVIFHSYVNVYQRVSDFFLYILDILRHPRLEFLVFLRSMFNVPDLLLPAGQLHAVHKLLGDIPALRWKKSVDTCDGKPLGFVATGSKEVTWGQYGAIPALSALWEAGSDEFFVWPGVSWRFDICFRCFPCLQLWRQLPRPAATTVLTSLRLMLSSERKMKGKWKKNIEKEEKERKPSKRLTKGIHRNSREANISFSATIESCPVT